MKKIKTQRNSVTCPESYSQQAVETGFKCRQTGSRARTFHHCPTLKLNIRQEEEYLISENWVCADIRRERTQKEINQSPTCPIHKGSA